MAISKSKGRIRERRAIREDEKNLYFIIERDLDRDELFPLNDGWTDQCEPKKGSRKRIDYVVKYGKYLVGIEVKFDFPREKDFKQADGYLNKKGGGQLDAIFLAYPSDRVGEALDMRERKEFPDIGLISIALFRSHIISPAKRRPSRGDFLLGKYFAMKSYLKDYKETSDLLEKRIIEKLDEEEFTNKSMTLKLFDDDYPIKKKIHRAQLKTLLASIKLMDIFSPLKYMNFYQLNKQLLDKESIKEELGFEPYLFEENLHFYDHMYYGTHLGVYSPSLFSYKHKNQVKTICTNLSKQSEINKIQRFVDKVKDKKEKKQRDWSKIIFFR